jgi:hypothetical protein
MRITKLENNNESRIDLNSGAKIYLLNGVFHRGAGQPAVITEYSEDYFYRGVKIDKDIAQGKLSPKEILSIPNIEIKQRAMEILGYEQFLRIFKEINSFTPPQFEGKFSPDEMYKLYAHHEKNAKEPTKILQMIDPSKRPFIKYFIRVPPSEVDCKEAVAHSYRLKTWEDFIFCKNCV